MNANAQPDAFIALGSNQGDSVRTIRLGMDRLQAFASAPIVRSSLWKTDPVDCPPGSRCFVNAVIGLRPRPGESPESLLSKLHSLEHEFGRTPKRILNEPRPLDLDLIAFRNETRETKTLTLPHPRAHLRQFVLEPLAEIAPALVLPGQLKTVGELLENLNSDGARPERVA